MRQMPKMERSDNKYLDCCKRGITAIETEKTENTIYPIKGSILGKGYDYGNSGHFEPKGWVGKNNNIR